MVWLSLADFAGLAMQIVSQAEARGEVAVQELADIQGQSFGSARVLVSNTIGGMEDIPVSLHAAVIFRVELLEPFT